MASLGVSSIASILLMAGVVAINLQQAHSGSSVPLKINLNEEAIKRAPTKDTCYKLTSGKTQLLAAGNTHKRFYLLSKDLMLFKVNMSNETNARFDEKDMGHINVRGWGEHLGKLYPKAWPALKQIAREVHYAFFTSAYVREIHIDDEYLLFVHGPNGCVLAIDLTSGDVERGPCDQQLHKLLPVSSSISPDIRMLSILRAGYVPGETRDRLCTGGALVLFKFNMSKLEAEPRPAHVSKEDFQRQLKVIKEGSCFTLKRGMCTEVLVGPHFIPEKLADDCPRALPATPRMVGAFALKPLADSPVMHFIGENGKLYTVINFMDLKAPIKSEQLDEFILCYRPDFFAAKLKKWQLLAFAALFILLNVGCCAGMYFLIQRDVFGANSKRGRKGKGLGRSRSSRRSLSRDGSGSKGSKRSRSKRSRSSLRSKSSRDSKSSPVSPSSKSKHSRSSSRALPSTSKSAMSSKHYKSPKRGGDSSRSSKAASKSYSSSSKR